jgi:hypothetical protein
MASVYTPTEPAPSSEIASDHWALQKGGLAKKARESGYSVCTTEPGESVHSMVMSVQGKLKRSEMPAQELIDTILKRKGKASVNWT